MIIDFFTVFKRTEQQIKAWDLISKFFIVLLYGGTRSGKSFLIICAIIYRALAAPKSDHLILRLTYKDCRRSIFQKTLKDALDLFFPNGAGYTLNKSDSIVILDNEARIMCDGLDENRIDSILGNEYATIFFNEISEIPYAIIETVLTRLAQVVMTIEKKPLTKKVFMDCNPPKKRHWVFKLFFDKVNPEDGTPLKYPEDYAVLQINPIHNINHLGEEYIEKTLGQLSKAKKKRFLYGEFGDDTEGALWKQVWIDQNRAKWDGKNNRYILPDFDKVVIAIDPAVTSKETSDETGIVAVASALVDKTRHYWVLSDLSGIYPVRKWAEIAIKEYKGRMADKIIGEVNNGGDLVESNIRAIDRNFNSFKSVRATRGKAIRAEPISTLYDKGFVHHVGIFDLLEDELTTWTPEDKESPNRLDALVWGITELMSGADRNMSVPSESMY